MKKPSFWSLLKKVHESEEGSVSLETVLIVGAIALPILIFLIYVAWPKIKKLFQHRRGEGGIRRAECRKLTPGTADAGHALVVDFDGGCGFHRHCPA